MDVETYRNFLAIVEAGSLTGAAEAVHTAQPALSKQLRSLENYFGTKLILTTRGSKHLILTDAGRILYHKAKYLCSLEDTAKNEIGNLCDGSRGTLRFSVANSRAELFIAACLEPFHRLYPYITYEIYEGGISEQSRQLLSGITELGILSVPPIHQHSFEILFRRKETITAVAAGSMAGGREKGVLSLMELSRVPLCLSTGCHIIMSRVFAAHGLKPRVLSICTTRAAALRWAAGGCGVAIVPAEPGETFPEGLRRFSIGEEIPDLYKTVVRVKGRPLSVVARKFLRFYNDVRHAERMIRLEEL